VATSDDLDHFGLIEAHMRKLADEGLYRVLGERRVGGETGASRAGVYPARLDRDDWTTTGAHRSVDSHCKEIRH